ncbi:hypothetical protein MW887_003517 [Aspergillus wentii]|nr:hypothetical protein MW887_003517 [Aspergillus wentii]
MPRSSIIQESRPPSSESSSGTSYSSAGSPCHNFAGPVDSISIPTEDTWMQTGLTLSPVALTAYPDIDDVPLDLEPITWDSSWGGTQSSDMFSGTDSYTSSMVNATSFDSRYNLPAVSYDAMYDRQGLAESTVAPSFNSAGVTHPNIESEQQENNIPTGTNAGGKAADINATSDAA